MTNPHPLAALGSGDMQPERMNGKPIVILSLIILVAGYCLIYNPWPIQWYYSYYYRIIYYSYSCNI